MQTRDIAREIRCREDSLAERRGLELSVPLGILRPRIEPRSSGVFAAIFLARLGIEQVRLGFGRCIQLAGLRGGGVEYEQHNRSLSEVARVITGSRWSGPLFFGLRQRVPE